MTTVVWSPDTRRHDPQWEVWVGVQTPGTEVAERVDRILEALQSAGHSTETAAPHGLEPVLAVHDGDLVEHLSTVWDRWMSSGIPGLVAQDRVVPYMFATERMLGGLPVRRPTALHALAGWYCYDTMTLIGPGTWEAARAAADCALTAVDLLLEGASGSAYALCRPPGHHVTRSAYGGSCYLNNAAIAAQALRAGGLERIAIVDIDAHHGNGTASIFYDRSDVLYGSVHVDPGAGWFPHVVGFADETGAAEGQGATVNVPLEPGSGDREWLPALSVLCERVREFSASALVVSLGVDAAAADSESPLQVSADGFRAAGELLADLGLPTVHIQEGGYGLPAIGPLVAALLSSFL